MEARQYPPRPQFTSAPQDDPRSSKRMRIGSPPPSHAGDNRYLAHPPSQSQHSRYPDRTSSLSPPADNRGLAYRAPSQQHLPPMSQHHSQREDHSHQSLYGSHSNSSTPPLSERPPPPGMPRDSHAQYRASPPNAPPYGNSGHQPHHHHQQQHQPQHHHHHQQQQQQQASSGDRSKGQGWYDHPDHRSQHHYPSMQHHQQPREQREEPHHHHHHHQQQQHQQSHHHHQHQQHQHQQHQHQQHQQQYPSQHQQHQQQHQHQQQQHHQYPSPYPPPPPSANSATHLQSTHNQLQRQLRQDDRTPPPSHHHSSSAVQSHHGSPSDHHHHVEHRRSASYQESRYPTPPLLSTSLNRGMPPPSSTSPHPTSSSSSRPPAPQFPQPSMSSGGPFQGGRDLPSISSLPFSRSASSMSLSSILGNDTPTRPRNEPPAHHIQHPRESAPPRPLQPEYSPSKRPYTPDYPSSAPPTERPRDNTTVSRSPSGGASSLPPIGRGSGIDTPPPTQSRSRPSPGLQPSPMPARPLSQPSSHHAQSQQAIHQEKIKQEEMAQQQGRAQSAFQSKQPHGLPLVSPRREHNQPPLPSPHEARQQEAPSKTQEQATSPAYHHLPASTTTAPAVPLSAYTTTMPASPFAITPALPNSTTLPMPPQFDSGVDKRRQNLSQSNIQFPGDRDRDNRERDVTPLRAEEALGQRVHERKAAAAAGQGSPMSGVISTGKISSPRPEKKTEDYGSAIAKREPEDIEMTGVNGVKAGLSANDKASKKVRRHAPGHHHHHHSSHTPHHHHHHHSKSDASMGGEDNIQGPLLQRTVASPGPPAIAPVNTAPTLPPKLKINNAALTEAMSAFPSAHLGSATYTPLVLDSETNVVKEQFLIPNFEERENCTFDVRIAARYLGVAERQKVCKKRMLWGSGVYTDDSNVIAVLIHEGHLPVVYNGVESFEYADEHDTALAKIAQAQQGKKSGRSKKDQLAASLLADGMPQPSQAVQKDKDLVVKLRIAPPLEKYGSSVRYGLKSRAWEKHDGMSFIVEEVKWMHKGAADARGSLGKRKRIPNLEEAKKVCFKTQNGELNIKERPGATWLTLSRQNDQKSVSERTTNGITTSQFPHKTNEVMAAG